MVHFVAIIMEETGGILGKQCWQNASLMSLKNVHVATCRRQTHTETSWRQIQRMCCKYSETSFHTEPSKRFYRQIYKHDTVKRGTTQ